ncbi:GAB1 GPI transamidase component GAB1 [Candida maltosa Xu316]
MSKLTSILIIGGLIRFLLPTLFPSLTSNLDSSVELSTPLTSFKSLLESFYYFDHGIDLYDGGINHNAPLLTIILSFVNQLPYSAVWFNLVYAVIDVLITLKLVTIIKLYNKDKKTTGFGDYLIASFYLFNPLIILTNLSHSTIVFTWLFIIESILQIIKFNNIPRSMISLAVAAYLSYNPIMLLPAIIALAHTKNRDKLVNVYVQGLAIFLISLILLLMTSFISTASIEFLNIYLTNITFSKITPNVGLWWYLFTEMFELYTSFYLIVFNVYAFLFIIPFVLRLFEFKNTGNPTGDSMLAVVVCLVWISFTKSYPIIGDLGFALSLVPMFKDTVIKHCKFMYIIGLTLLISLILSPIFYYIWIVLGTGNANFFYSISLIWGGLHILILMDLVWSQLSIDYYQDNGVKLDDEKSEKTPPVLAQL